MSSMSSDMFVGEHGKNMAAITTDRNVIDGWSRVTRFEDAPKNILSQCTVASSGATLSQALRHSMSPYFIIETNE